MNNQTKKLIRGAIFSLLVPLLGISIFYFAKFVDYSLADYISAMQRQKIMAPVISLSLIPNILLFFFFVNRNRFKEGQGVILGMFLWGAVIVYFKFFA